MKSFFIKSCELSIEKFSTQVNHVHRDKIYSLYLDSLDSISSLETQYRYGQYSEYDYYIYRNFHDCAVETMHAIELDLLSS